MSTDDTNDDTIYPDPEDFRFSPEEAERAHRELEHENPPDWDADWDDEPTIAPLPETHTSWGELDGAAYLRGDLDEPPPSVLQRTDGPSLLYRGKVSSIAGEPESGKGWFALHAAAQVMKDDKHVVYVDFEDSPKSVFGRLVALGLPAHLIAEKFHYVRPTEALTKKGGTTDDGEHGNTRTEFMHVCLRALEAQGGLALIVFDGITEALATQGIESSENGDVAAWFGNVPRWFAHNTKAAVLLIDHVTKATDGRGRFAIGAQSKLAAVDGSQFTAELTLPFARGRAGLVRISVSKDRPGHVREFATGLGHIQAIGDLIVTPRGDAGGLRLTLAPPDLQVNEGGSVSPTGVEGAILKYLQKVKGQSRGREAILDMVKGRGQTKRQAFNNMLDNGWLVPVKNGRKIEYKLGAPKDAT